MMTSPDPSFAEVLRSRRSVRRFRPDMPPRDLIEQVLEAATLAPSASNRQPWRFLVVKNPERIAAMAAAVRLAKERVATHIDDGCRDAFLAYGDYFTRFEGAPLVIGVLCRGAQVLSHLVRPTLPEEDRRNIARMERDSGLIGAAMAMENLLLMAQALGLGASGMTGPLLADGALRTILSVPTGWEIAALIPLGFPDEAPAPTERKSAALVTRWIE